MDLSELEGVTIQKNVALSIIRAHGCEYELSDFYKNLGNKKTYSAIKVYHWLGY